ncbi:MAG: DUF1273 family protein, partial [Clostridia bacterium]|nr:DUF1273 family protein [Clostridia bacterium]
AKGFDLKCFETLLEYKRKNKNIEIIACVPCENQQEGYNLIEKQIYNNCLEKADKIITLNKEYFNGCMQQRNRFMVDNSSIIIAYMYAERGGTLYTVNYAKKKSKEIIYI